MPADWYSELLRRCDELHESLVSAKANAVGDREYQKDLKYQLKGFRNGVEIIRSNEPFGDETQFEFLDRIVPLVSEIPTTVDPADAYSWNDGIRELLRSMAVGTAFDYQRFVTRLQFPSPSLLQRLRNALGYR